MFSTINRIGSVTLMLLLAGASNAAESIADLQDKLDQAMSMILTLQQELEELRQADSGGANCCRFVGSINP